MTRLVPCCGLALALLGAQCATGGRAGADTAAGAAAFAVVHRVLQHPRCVNCHPAGRAPLQGDDGRPHGQFVVGGDDGKGVLAMKCASCHGVQNGADPHTPPGAPGWHLPPAAMPLVFEGRSAAELAAQLADPRRNGGRSPQQILEHVERDPLVLWGWDPGPGRTPVDVPHAAFVAAMRTWIAAGCPLPR
jgi:hypothetical protein